MPEANRPSSNVTSLGEQLRRALDSAGTDSSPTAGRLIGALLSALASSGGDDLVEASLVPDAVGPIGYEVRCYDIGSIVASASVPCVDGAEAVRTAMAMVVGPDQTVEVVAREPGAEERCVLMRSFDGAPVYVFEDTAPSLEPRLRASEGRSPSVDEREPPAGAPVATSAADRPPGAPTARPPAPAHRTATPEPEPARWPRPPTAGQPVGRWDVFGPDDEPTGPMAVIPARQPTPPTAAPAGQRTRPAEPPPAVRESTRRPEPPPGVRESNRPTEPPQGVRESNRPTEPPQGVRESTRRPEPPPGVRESNRPTEPPRGVRESNRPTEPPRGVRESNRPTEPPRGVRESNRPAEPPPGVRASTRRAEPPPAVRASTRRPEPPPGVRESTRRPEPPPGVRESNRPAGPRPDRVPVREDAVPRSPDPARSTDLAMPVPDHGPRRGLPADIQRPRRDLAARPAGTDQPDDQASLAKRQAEVVEQTAIILSRLPNAADVADQARAAKEQAEAVEQLTAILADLPNAADVADAVRLATRQAEAVNQVTTALARLPTGAEVADAVRSALAETTVSVDLSGALGPMAPGAATASADDIAEVVVNRLVSEGRLPQATDPTGWLAALVPTAEEVADVVVRRLGPISAPAPARALVQAPAPSAVDMAAAVATRLGMEMELGRLETDVVREQMQDIQHTLDSLADAVACSERRLVARVERLGDALVDDMSRLRREAATTRLPELGQTVDALAAQMRLLLAGLEPTEDAGAPVTPIQRPTPGARRPSQRRSGA